MHSDEDVNRSLSTADKILTNNFPFPKFHYYKPFSTLTQCNDDVKTSLLTVIKTDCSEFAYPQSIPRIQWFRFQERALLLEKLF